MSALWGVGPRRGLGSGVLRFSRLSIPDHSREMLWWGLGGCHVKRPRWVKTRPGSPAPTDAATPIPRNADPRAGSRRPRACSPLGSGPVLSRGPRSPRSPAPWPRGGVRAHARPPRDHVTRAAHSDDVRPAQLSPRPPQSHVTVRRSLITRRPAPGRRPAPLPPPRRVLLSKMAAPGALPPRPPPPPL